MNISQSKLATLPTTRAPATGEYFGPVLRQAVLARWMGARRCQKELWGTLKKTRDDKSVQWLDGILCISTAVRIWKLQWYIQGFSLVSHDPPNLRRSDRIIIRYIKIHHLPNHLRSKFLDVPRSYYFWKADHGKSSGVALDFCHHSTDVGPVGIRDGQPRFCGNPLGICSSCMFLLWTHGPWKLDDKLN